MQLLTHTSNTHLHAITRPHFNIEFDFDVSVRTCMMSTVASKSTLGKFSESFMTNFFSGGNLELSLNYGSSDLCLK